MDHIFFIHSIADGHLGYFHVLPAVNRKTWHVTCIWAKADGNMKHFYLAPRWTTVSACSDGSVSRLKWTPGLRPSTVSNSVWPHQAPLSMGFSRRETLRWGCHFLRQGIFPTLGSNPPFVSPVWAAGFFTTRGTWQAPKLSKASILGFGAQSMVFEPAASEFCWGWISRQHLRSWIRTCSLARLQRDGLHIHRYVYKAGDSMDKSKVQEMVKDRGAWCGPVRGVPESRTRPRDRTGTRVDKTLCFQCRGWEFDVWLGTIPRAWCVAVENLPAMQDTWVWSLVLGRSPREGCGNPLWYSCLENPHRQRRLVGDRPMGLQRVRHNWATFTCSFSLQGTKIRGAIKKQSHLKKNTHTQFWAN